MSPLRGEEEIDACAPEPHADDQRAAEVRRVTWVGLAGSLGLSVLKFILGTAGRSQAVVADAAHSLSDAASDMAILVGVRYWTAPPDENHPYGHWRIETLVTTAIGVALAGVGIGIGYHAVATLRQPVISRPGWIAFFGSMISIVVKEALYHWTRSVGRRHRSSALLANAWHHRSDALSSIPPAVAVLVAIRRPGWALVDPVGALIVACLILWAAWKIVRPAVGELADEGASPSIRARLLGLALSVEDVCSVHALRTRRTGPGLHVDIHVTVDGSMNVARGHAAAEAVKRRLLDQGPDVLDVIVHLGPDAHDSAGEG